MNKLLIVLGILTSLSTFASETLLICNDQNSHAIFELQISEDTSTSVLKTLLADSTLLASGTRVLTLQEGESSATLSTYAGKTNSNLHIALLLNTSLAETLKTSEILEVNVYYQKQKGGMLDGKTLLLCSRR